VLPDADGAFVVALPRASGALLLLPSV
jgi:hypothetical protein